MTQAAKPNRRARPRHRFLAPLIYAAAVLLLIEDWFWDTGARLVQRIAAWPPIHALEVRIRALPPWAALTAFILPAVLLFPVKVLALLAMAHGHALLGVTVILLAKLGGAAAVARLYTLTKPTLLEVTWFARWHNWFMSVKDRWIGYLRSSRPYRLTKSAMARTRRALQHALARLRPHQSGPRARTLRRFITQWRARRREP